MRIFWLCFFACLAFSGLSQPQVLIEKAPDWASDVHYSEQITDTANIGGGYHYLLIDRQCNAERSETYRRYSIKVLSEQGLQFASSVSDSYDPAYEKLVFHHIRIKRGNRTINKLDAQKFEILRQEENRDRHIYDGRLSAVMNLEDVQPGDIVDYAYTIRGANPLFKGKFFISFYCSFDVPVGKFHFALTAKKGRDLQFKYFNTNSRLQATEKTGMITHSIELESPPTLLSEDRTPGWFDPYGRIDISEFKSWPELNGWAQAVFKVSEKPSAGLLAKINEIKKGSEKKEDQIRKTIEFVQDEIRYLSFSTGINGFQPHPPHQVFTQRFGDCKDKSLLLSFMLQQLGIDCKPALVSTDYGKTMKERLPSPYLFNHCIARINYNDSLIWVDPTLSFQRGPLHSRTVPTYHNALIIGGENELKEIPFGLTRSGVHIQETYYLDEVGKSARLEVVTTFSADEADFARQNRQGSSLEEINKMYLNFYATDYPTITADHPVMFNDNVEANELVTNEAYHIGSFWTYDSVAKQFSSQTYARYLADYLKSPETKLRNTPYSIAHPVNVGHDITVIFPQPWSVKDAHQTIETGAFRFTSNALYFDKTLQLRYSYQTKKDFIDTSEVRDYVEKTKKVRDGLSFLFTYSPGSTSGSGASSISWPALGFTAVVGVLIFFAFRKLYDFDPDPMDQPYYTSIGGWLILPAFGLLLSPVTMTFSLINGGFFTSAQWSPLLDSASASFNLKLGLVVFVEFFLNLLLVGLTIFVNLLFWKRRTSLPRFVIYFYVYNFGIQVVDFLLLNYFELGTGAVMDVIKPLVVASIWVPYFLVSDRVKSTFTNRR